MLLHIVYGLRLYDKVSLMIKDGKNGIDPTQDVQWYYVVFWLSS